jgi:hypothetical protein
MDVKCGAEEFLAEERELKVQCLVSVLLQICRMLFDETANPTAADSHIRVPRLIIKVFFPGNSYYSPSIHRRLSAGYRLEVQRRCVDVASDVGPTRKKVLCSASI